MFATPRRRIALHLAAVAASALVLVLNGTAWGLSHDVTSGMVTTDVIMGGSGGGPQDILLVGVDSRTDAQGNPLPQEVLEQLHTGGDNPRVLNSNTIILLHIPRGRRGRRRLLRCRATASSTFPATAKTRSTRRTRRSARR